MLSMSRSNVTNVYVCLFQGCITCGAIDEPRKSSKAIDERVIITFRDKNVVIAGFRDKNVAIARFRDKNKSFFHNKMSRFAMIFHDMS